MTGKPILVAVDYSDCSIDALAYAATLARRLGAPLTVVHITWEPPPHASELLPGWSAPVDAIEKAKARLSELIKARPMPPGTTLEILQGEPFETIVNFANPAHFELVVMGTHGRSGLPRLLMGSVAERVVRLAKIPVLTVRHQQPDGPSGLNESPVGLT